MKRGVAVLAATVMVLWPACGESDEQALPGRASPGAGAGPTAAPTEGEGEEGFVVAANAACERADERMTAVKAPPSHRDLPRFSWMCPGSADQRVCRWRRGIASCRNGEEVR